MMLLILASAISWAQTDSSKVNQLSVGLDFMTHGEACGGGMPRTDSKDIEKEDQSRFLLGRTRLKVDYQRSGLQIYAVIQNKYCCTKNAKYQRQAKKDIIYQCLPAGYKIQYHCRSSDDHNDPKCHDHRARKFRRTDHHDNAKRHQRDRNHYRPSLHFSQTLENHKLYLLYH